jgi:Tfp pilus assembly protein PilE
MEIPQGGMSFVETMTPRIQAGSIIDNHKKMSAFTITEIMVVIVLICLLLSASVSGYRNFLVKGYRSEAQNALILLAVAMEKNEARSFDYSKLMNSDGTMTNVANSLTSGLPNARLFPSVVPYDEDVPIYTLTMTVTQDAYTLFATPIPGSPNESDGVLTLNHLGEKSHDRKPGW